MAQEVTRSEAKGSAALWFGVLAAPAAWSVQLVIGGELPELGCAPGAGAPDIYGFGIEAILRAATVALALVALAGGVVAFRCWRKERYSTSSPENRAGWMALAGVMTSAVFFVIIVLGLFPTWYLTGCGRSL